jgi:hypothetical protein
VEDCSSMILIRMQILWDSAIADIHIRIIELRNTILKFDKSLSHNKSPKDMTDGKNYEIIFIANHTFFLICLCC